MPRMPRISFPGAIHHVYSRGVNKSQLFFTEDDYDRFLTKAEELVKSLDTAILSWTVLPNHFHFLLRVGKTPLPLFMKRLLTSYAVYHNNKYQRSGSLFQNRYGSRLVQDDPYFLHVSRYIHLNPVHAGLTHDPRSYRFSGMSEFYGQSEWQLLNQKNLQILIGKGKNALDEYLSFVLAGINKDLSEYDPFLVNREVIGSSIFNTRRIRKHRRLKKGL